MGALENGILKNKLCVDVKYNTSIISFLDILGFEDIVNKAASPIEVFKILEKFKREAKHDEKLAKMYEQKFSNFSDTVVRTTHILSEENRQFQVGILFCELLHLIHIQSLLICEQGVFIRGCVTIGEICQEGSHIFGPGLNKAYHLEKEKAIYPRIIIDPHVFDLLEQSPLLRSCHHTLEMEKESIEELVREASDGIRFLDYLKVMSEECDDYYAYGQFLERHKQLIVECSEKFKEANDIGSKYKWLTEYHNEVVASVSNKMFKSMGYNRDDLQIT